MPDIGANVSRAKRQHLMVGIGSDGAFGSHCESGSDIASRCSYRARSRCFQVKKSLVRVLQDHHIENSIQSGDTRTEKSTRARPSVSARSAVRDNGLGHQPYRRVRAPYRRASQLRASPHSVPSPSAVNFSVAVATVGLTNSAASWNIRINCFVISARLEGRGARLWTEQLGVMTIIR
jgi:hypothetical protein